MPSRHRLTLLACSTLSAFAVGLLPASAAAQSPARIVEVLVFPGGAEVQRQLSVAAGSSEAVFSCIPARIQLDSLQARAAAGSSNSLQVGELRVQTLASDAVPECSGNPQLDAQIRELEDQRAALQAERGAQELVLGHLKATADPKALPPAAQLDQLRRQAEASLKAQHGLQRRIEQLDDKLRPLLAERDAARGGAGGGIEQWHRVSVRVAGSGELLLTSRSPYAGWQPVYRADLDSNAARIAFERRAEVQQTTGETWRGVRLMLSTRQPQRGMGLPDPQPWWLRQIEPARRLQGLAAESASAQLFEAPPAPAMSMARAKSADAASIELDLPSFQTDFDLQFNAPEPVTLASGNERRSLTLQRLSWPAELVTQVQPRAQAQAYLMATLKRPEGFFPAGKLLLSRDGQWVGETRFALDDEAEQRLFFGPDDRLRLRIEPEQREAANGGFIGNRRVLALQRRYVLENTGSKALNVQVVEAGPVPQHEDIKVETRFDPTPTVSRWRDLDGVVVWRFNLPAKGQQRVSARYELSAPREMGVVGWP